jgi:hypothetical protein
MSDYALTVYAAGTVEEKTRETDDGVDIVTSTERQVDAQIELDADRLYNSDIAQTYRAGATIHASDVAAFVGEQLDVTVIDPKEWTVTVAGPLNDWQWVALKAAEKKHTGRRKTKTIQLAIEILTSLHEEDADSDRPILAALNLDESYNGSEYRDHLLKKLGNDSDPAEDVTAETGGDEEAAEP